MSIIGHSKLSPWVTTDYFMLPLSIPHEASQSERVFKALTPGIGASLDCTEYPLTKLSSSKIGSWYAPSSSDKAITIRYFYWQARVEARNITVTCVSMLPTGFGFTITAWTLWAGPEDSDPVELVADDIEGQSEIYYSGLCHTYSMIVVTDELGNSSSNPDLGLLALVCKPKIDITDFDVTFDSLGSIISYDKSQARLDNHPSLISIEDGAVLDFWTLFGYSAWLSVKPLRPDLDMLRHDWLGYLMTSLNATMGSSSTVGSATYVAELASEVYSRVFSTYLSTVQDTLLNKNGPKPEVQVTPYSREPRMVPSIPLFIVTFLLLGLYVVAFVVVMIFRRQRYAGPRMPISIGSLIPWIAHSTMLGDFKDTQHLSSDLRDEYLDSLGKKYGFGWFYGTDGKLHLGLEQEPLLDRFIL